MVEIWPDRDTRLAVQNDLAARLADLVETLQAGPIAPQAEPAAIRARLVRYDFRRPVPMADALADTCALLASANVHMMHPGYLGLFNPAVSFAGMLADQITATLNPQLAVWSHAPAAVEIERHTIAAIAGLAGWGPEQAAGHFTTGGAEANFTAVLLALTRCSPDFAEGGGRVLPGSPRLYVSAESHLAWLKIAHQAGLGRRAVRLVPTDGGGRMDPTALQACIASDRRDGDLPVMVGATAGTTNAGMIDPLPECAAVACDQGLWFHVDAAWGGAGLLSPTAASRLAGIERADSITIDAHKWLAAPMGAGMLLCRDERLLGETFRVAASYMPPVTSATVDPYTHSIQWSRRFVGLKLFLTLAVLGWDGCRAHVERSLRLAEQLRGALEARGWHVVNDSPLAVLCFVDREAAADPERVAAHVVADGRCWISSAQFEGRPVLRACITSHFTDETVLESLVDSLQAARSACAGTNPPQG